MELKLPKEYKDWIELDLAIQLDDGHFYRIFIPPSQEQPRSDLETATVLGMSDITKGDYVTLAWCEAQVSGLLMLRRIDWRFALLRQTP